VDEGTVVPVSNVLVTIVNTDPQCYWVTSFFETAILRAVWYGTTVCTNSYMSKEIILKYLEETGDPSTINFKLHDFGARGVSSFESSGLGGAAHLVNFLGTDNVTGLIFANNYYDADIAGFSIPAMEHSTITSWGRENEADSYRNMIKKNAKSGGVFACVSDSYDIFEACRMWGTVLKQDVLDSGATLVVRPDSGDPAEVVLKCLEILAENYGYTINSKGFKVLNNVRVIQGDGINAETIEEILAMIVNKGGFSADNVAFGQGGGLLQQLDRDTMKFAMKCSAICVNGQWRDVYKDPITDKGKRSKKGLLDLVRNDVGEFVTVQGFSPASVLRTRYYGGTVVSELTFDEVRANSIQ
jgi:nicotinamide phosphoribosyltransferase